MLARPEVGTKEHVLLWLASKPPEETYIWEKGDICACGQYTTANADVKHNIHGYWARIPALCELNNLACTEPRNFGALYERAYGAWSHGGDVWDKR